MKPLGIPTLAILVLWCSALTGGIDNGTQLIEAAFDANAEKVSLFLDRGTDPAFVDSRGFSALSAAAFHGAYAVAKRLLEAGADIDFAPSERRLTPLMWALLPVVGEPSVTKWRAQDRQGSLEEEKVRVALLLVRHSADLTLRNADGETALMLASSYRRRGLRPLLNEMLARGANPSSINNYGRTALMYAAFTRNYVALTALLEHGADPLVTDHSSRSALSIASEQQDRMALTLLCSHLRKGGDAVPDQRCVNRPAER